MGRLLLDLPDEILLNILLRLSLDALLQCKSACKKFQSLVSDPNFQKLRLDRPADERHGIFLWRPRNPKLIYAQKDNVASLALDIPHILNELQENNEAFVHPDFDPVIQIWGSCNGFLVAYVVIAYNLLLLLVKESWTNLFVIPFIQPSTGRMRALGFPSNEEILLAISKSVELQPEEEELFLYDPVGDTTRQLHLVQAQGMSSTAEMSHFKGGYFMAIAFEENHALIDAKKGGI